MDHRYLTRTPLTVTVDVFRQEHYLGRFRTRDIDVEGVFIEMPVYGISPNDVLELVFRLPAADRCNHALFAGVARIADDGAGLMLFDRGEVTLEILNSVAPDAMLAAS